MASIYPPPKLPNGSAYQESALPEPAAAEEFTYSGAESLSGVRFGSVQTWYVRAVERCPRFTIEAERKFRERLAEAYFHVSVPFGFSVEACRVLAELVVDNPASVARSMLVRWPQRTEQGEEPFELVRMKLEEALAAHERLASATDGDERDRLAEDVTRVIYEFRPSDAALDIVEHHLKKLGTPEAVEASEALRHPRKALERLRNQLIDSHLRVVLRELRRVSRSGVEKRELLQEGNLGLMKAAELFDETRNVPFGAYALSWVRACMRRTLVEHRSGLRMPPGFRREVSELRHAADSLRQRHGGEPTVEELAAEVGLEVERVRSIVLKHALASQVSSLHALGEHESSFDERLPDPNGVSALDFIEQRQLLSWLENAVEGLPEREQEILKARFALGGGDRSTLAELGERFGISGERVRQIETQSLERLSSQLKRHAPSTIPPRLT